MIKLLIPVLVLGLCGDGTTSFAVDLHKILKPATENQFFSPISITAALGMTEARARGPTAEQMQKALHFSGEKRHEELGALLKSLGGKTRKENGYELAIANRLWPQKDYALQKGFTDTMKSGYGATFEGLDYKTDAEGARQAINKWVEGETHDKIKDLIAEGILTADTRLVLVNAIYFKGEWQFTFDKAITKEADFFTTPDGPVKAPLMYQKADFKYAETGEVQAVEIPFKSGEISMVVLLPRAKDGLAKFEAGLTPESLAKLTAQLVEKEKVRLTLPRFKMECGALLNDPLKKLGMIDAFGPSADFSGMTGNTELYISAVIHKAFIEVNEEGAEAAAATAVVMERKGEAEPPKEFRADHPFLFLIRDVKTGTILFQGRLVKP